MHALSDSLPAVKILICIPFFHFIKQNPKLLHGVGLSHIYVSVVAGAESEKVERELFFRFLLLREQSWEQIFLHI